MNVIAIVNQKGGVGKTTTTINLAAALAAHGKKAIVIDLDPQRNATTSLNGGVPFVGYDINDLIYHAVCGHPYNINGFIYSNEVERVDFIPATSMLASAPNILAQDTDSSAVLRRVLASPELADVYDFALIDCKPSMDLLVTNALVAANGVIVPVQPEDYALDGLGDLLDTIKCVQQRYNTDLKIHGIVITRANLQRKVTREIVAALKEMFPDLLFNTIIPDRADCAKAQRAGQSMVNNNGNALGCMYKDLAKEVIERVERP